MTSTPVRLYRWDEIALEKVTEMISRKIITGEREMVTQIYLKRGALVPMHQHESEQMTYVLQGALKFRVEDEEQVPVGHSVLSVRMRSRRSRSATPARPRPTSPRPCWACRR